MSVIIKQGCHACTRKAGIFRLLKESEIDQIDCTRVSLMYNPGEVIFKQGAPCNHMICVTSGLVKIYLEHQNNHNLIIGLVRPTTYIYDPGVFADHRHHFTAVATEETTACLIDVSVMQMVMRKNPEFLLGFVEKVSGQVIDLYSRFSSYTQKHVFGRVADVLLFLHPGIYPEHPVHLTLSRQDLADLSGMTKESFIRVLKKFKEDQLISLNGDCLEILNQEKLEAISRSG